MDPYEFRLKNLIEDGDETLTGGHYQSIKAKATLNAVVKAAGYRSPKPANAVVASRWVTAGRARAIPR
jgi:CO/xanthine dehydrogenase Mo-binding subunit